MQPRDAWIIRSVFFSALAARLLALLLGYSSDLRFEKFFLAAGRLIADGWMPADAFAYSPAYTYFLAVLLRIGASPISIALVQVMLGALTCVAICELARRLFGSLASAIAGGTAVLFGSFLIYDTSFESDGFGLCLFCFMALAVVWATERPAPARFALAGLLLGLRAAQRPDVLLLLPLAIVILWGTFGRDWGHRRTAGYSAALCLAALMPLWPITAMNYRATGEIVPVMSSAGWVFYTSNNHAASGLSYYPPPLALEQMQQRPDVGEDPLARLDDAVSRRVAGVAVGHSLSAAEAAHFWMREGWNSVRRRGAGQIGLQARKIFYMFHAYEGHDNLVLLVKERNLNWWIAIGMGVLSPFALVGIALAVRSGPARDRRLWFMAAFLAVPIISMSLFYVGPRFRLELAAMLLPFAGYCVVQLYQLVRARAFRPLGMAAAALGLLAVVFNIPTPGLEQQRRSRTIQLETFLGERATTGEEARGHFLRATASAVYPAEAEAAYRGLAALAGARGARDGAARYRDIADGRLPDEMLAQLGLRTGDPEALWAIGRHHLLKGNPDRALTALAEAVRLDPDDPDLRFARAIAARQDGAEGPEVIAASIETALDLGLRFSPGAVDAYIVAGRCYLELNRRDAAAQSFVRALRRARGNETARWLLAKTRQEEEGETRPDLETGLSGSRPTPAE